MTENVKRVDESVTRVTYRWDAPGGGVEPGWYCESWVGDVMEDDSQKVWFPVGVDDFGRDEADGLEAALGEAFPRAEVEFLG